jgi:hypothetical protein
MSQQPYIPSFVSRQVVFIGRNGTPVKCAAPYVWARQGSNLRPNGYEPSALPLSYGPSRDNFTILRLVCYSQSVNFSPAARYQFRDILGRMDAIYLFAKHVLHPKLALWELFSIISV